MERHGLPNPTVAKIVGGDDREFPMFFERDMEAAILAERERCIAILLDGNYWNGCPSDVFRCALNRAEAIRAPLASKQAQGPEMTMHLHPDTNLSYPPGAVVVTAADSPISITGIVEPKA